MQADRAHHVVHARIVGFEQHGLLQRFVGLGAKFELDVHEAEQKMHGRILRFQRTGMREVAQRSLMITRLLRGACQVQQDGNSGLAGRHDPFERLTCDGKLPALHVDGREPPEEVRSQDAPAIERGEEPTEDHVALHVLEGGEHSEHVFGRDVGVRRQRVGDRCRGAIAAAGEIGDANGERLGPSLHVWWQPVEQLARRGKLASARAQQRRLEERFDVRASTASSAR